MKPRQHQMQMKLGKTSGFFQRGWKSLNEWRFDYSCSRRANSWKHPKKIQKIQQNKSVQDDKNATVGWTLINPHGRLPIRAMPELFSSATTMAARYRYVRWNSFGSLDPESLLRALYFRDFFFCQFSYWVFIRWFLYRFVPSWTDNRAVRLNLVSPL